MDSALKAMLCISPAGCRFEDGRGGCRTRNASWLYRTTTRAEQSVSDRPHAITKSFNLNTFGPLGSRSAISAFAVFMISVCHQVKGSIIGGRAPKIFSPCSSTPPRTSVRRPSNRRGHSCCDNGTMMNWMAIKYESRSWATIFWGFMNSGIISNSSRKGRNKVKE
jgi:hypothetical protein